MMQLQKKAQAGTVESTDILIMIAPSVQGTGIKIDLNSPVINQYGRHIKSLITCILKAHLIEDAEIIATDNGALDYTIDARVRTAITRALA